MGSYHTMGAQEPLSPVHTSQASSNDRWSHVRSVDPQYTLSSQRTSFLGSPSGTPRNQPGPARLIIIPQTLVDKVKDDAQAQMFRSMFQQGLFPSVENTTVMATSAMEAAIALRPNSR